jgi:hypothetical protein
MITRPLSGLAKVPSSHGSLLAARAQPGRINSGSVVEEKVPDHRLIMVTGDLFSNRWETKYGYSLISSSASS